MDPIDSGDVRNSSRGRHGNSRKQILADLNRRISPEEFRSWYQEKQFAQNIRNGQHYFNGPSPVTPAKRHSPGSLLQCHRKTYYNQLNAPEESSDPNGIFWFGTKFEEEIILPYLRDVVVDDDTFVSNSLWVDFTVETDAGELRIKGETDPVVIDREADPLLLFEIKTKRTVTDVNKPNLHHRAQAHAYMRGLSEKYNQEVSETVILYGSRVDLEICSFEIEFDNQFWEDVVLDWASTHTTYRIEDELPPDTPEFGWECDFCDYKQRCGRGESICSHSDAEGFVPSFSTYPREKVVEYLRSHDSAKLTPTLAWKYPTLAEKYGAYDWQCSRCSTSHTWNSINPREESSGRPSCPSCSGVGPSGELAGPAPSLQAGENL